MKTHSFPADWPVFAGHFPGRPIVPGAELVRCACDAAQGELVEVVRFVFLAPVYPDETVELRIDQHDGLTRVSLCVDGVERARGTLRMSQA